MAGLNFKDALNRSLSVTKTYIDNEIDNHKHDEYLTQHQDLSSYAKLTDLHSHSNKSVLDNITAAKVTEWNNKSTFSGNYNDLTNKPTIPTVTNNLTNDLKRKYDTAYTHSQSSHAPVNAQKNSDITKAEIEAKLTGNITSHTHSQYLTQHQSLSGYATETYVNNKITALVDSAPEAMNTLNELAVSIKNHNDEYTAYVSTVSNALAGKAPLSHTTDTTVHITAAERSAWNAKSSLALGETSSTAYRGDRGKAAYDHSLVAHAPSTAQKNSDITKAEIEAKLTGNITSHTHSSLMNRIEETELNTLLTSIFG